MTETKYIQVKPEMWQRNKNDVEKITVLISYDDLTTGATFQVQLFDIDENFIDTVNVLCTGKDYESWNGNNEFPVNFSCQQLGLTIVNE